MVHLGLVLDRASGILESFEVGLSWKQTSSTEIRTVPSLVKGKPFLRAPFIGLIDTEVAIPHASPHLGPATFRVPSTITAPMRDKMLLLVDITSLIDGTQRWPARDPMQDRCGLFSE